jgi:hypothetical protein
LGLCQRMATSGCPRGQGFVSPSSRPDTLDGATENDGACTACVPGQYSATEGPSMCIPCGAGTFSNASGSTVCTKCPLGRSLVDGSGNLESHDAEDDCEVCPKLSFGPVAGLGEPCFPCLTTGDVEGSTQCTGCGPGQYKIDDQGNCEDCAEGK